MVNSPLQVVGVCLALIGCILSFVCTFMKTWAQNDIKGEVIEMSRNIRGLWSYCSMQSNGMTSCDEYDSIFLGLPLPLQGARAFACTSIVLSFFGILLGVFGMDCSTITGDNTKLKARMVIVSGALHFISGASIGAAVSWYASDIFASYHHNINAISAFSAIEMSGQRMVYGPALFVGWSAMVISIISGLILCGSSWNAEDEDDGGHAFAYNPPSRPKTAAEYI